MKTLLVLRLLRLSRFWCSLGLMAWVIAFAPSPGNAVQIQLGFDTGAYDPNVVPVEPGTHCPCDWLEDGFRVAGFWARQVGDPAGVFVQGHTHFASSNYSGNTGDSERQHAWTDDLMGLYISLENGAAFDLVSVDYRLRKRTSTDPLEQPLPWSYAVDDVQMLLATSFDPTLADFEGQWTAIDIDDGTPHGSSGIAFPPSDVPYVTHNFSGLNGITGFYISSTAYTNFDNFVLEVQSPVPEPSTGLLLGLGLTGLAWSRRFSASCKWGGYR